MKVSLEWLSQYVDIAELSPEAIGESLTNAGLEVEAVERVGAKFSKVVVGKCAKLDPHPNADKLRLATVNLGSETVQVVCGAKNLEEGMIIAFAQDGAQVINRKDGTPFVLGKAVIRGVESTGMICSLDELGLQDDYPKGEDGIWPLADYANESQLGQNLADVLGLESDVILHTAPTANRGDQMSMIGIAREIAALFDRPLKLPEIPEFSKKDKQPDIRVQLDDKEVCQYYGGLMLDNSQAIQSPAWMRRRLEACGTRSINAIVDATNYVMLEMGQPLHAFDRDKFNGSTTIGVRRAVQEEAFTTLDDAEHTLTMDSVLITVNDHPVALAGVMGGQNTEIGDDSKNLLLEAAYFPPATNRKNAKSVGIRTESSARFERGVDRYQTRKALFRAAQLIQELTGAVPVGLTESEPLQPELPQILLRLPRIASVIGLDIPKERVIASLEKLGFGVAEKCDAELLVTVPSWRLDDVMREIDLIEEVVRIYGYDNVPYTLPKKVLPVPYSLRQDFIARVQDCMQASGCHQVMTSSLIGPALLEKTGFQMDEKQLVTVVNSHSTDHTLMRQSLVPNLLEVAKHNQAQGIADVWVYELGKTYFKVGKNNHKQTGVTEKLCLGVMLSGKPQQGQWHGSTQTDFYALKGIVENLLSRLFGKSLPSLTFTPETSLDYLHPGKAAQILLDGKSVGVIGEVHPIRQNSLKLRQAVYLAELNLELVFKRYKQSLQAPEPVKLSPYPAIDRDMALLVQSGISHQQILDTVASLKDPLLQSVSLFDEYTGDKLPEGTRSLAYRMTFQSLEQTLTDQQVETSVATIKKTLTEKLAVQLR